MSYADSKKIITKYSAHSEDSEGKTCWTKLNFGKHRGRTLPQVLFNDPNYFFWLCQQRELCSGSLGREARELFRKARSIKVPGNGERVVEYYIHRPTGKFARFELVPYSRPEHCGSSPTFRSPVIDLSVPRQYDDWDKLGYKNFLLHMKAYLFGDPYFRMTKRRCEEFFEEDSNFSLNIQ